MMPTLAASVQALRDRLARLEEGPAVVGDWHRLEAAAARALIAAQNLGDEDGEYIDELHLIRMTAQARLYAQTDAAPAVSR
jgi:hypothetical protein